MTNTSSSVKSDKKPTSSGAHIASPDHADKSRGSFFFRHFRYCVLLGIVAVGFGCLHRYHVSTMFENDRHFSHLSTIEREMSFSTEMGLYYFYFKSLAEAPTFTEGLYEITHNNLTEFPKVINTLERFNLFPEVVAAGLYRMYMLFTSYLDLTTVRCWHVNLGDAQSRTVLSCDGLGVPVYFYLETVWFCAGLTMAIIFLFGVFLSDSFVGGLLAVACFFFNHRECTRVQWTPPLRESFAYPFLLLQMLLISRILQSGNTDARIKKEALFNRVKHVSLVSCLCHLLWQFSSFVMATQMACIILMYCVGNINRSTFISILASHTSAVATALPLMWGNELLLGSLLTLVLALSWLSLLLEMKFPIRSESIRRLSAFCTGVPATLLLFRIRQDLFGSRQDTHVFNILLSKFTSYKDFHTLLYTCSPEFDFLPFSTIVFITESGLLPAAVAGLLFLCISWAKTLVQPTSPKRQKVSGKGADKKEQGPSKKKTAGPRNDFGSFWKLEPHLLYHVLQLLAFMVLALLIMRLKLFFTPHLCLTVALLASPKMVPFVHKREVQWGVIAVLLSIMSFKGLENIHQQRSILGEYSNAPMEEMLTWVKHSTESKAVFAGPMAIMANLLLSTRRPVVNHPHYEDFELRERTKAIYSIYSNKTPWDVTKILSTLHVQYVVVDITYCHRSSRKGCSMEYLWSVEDPKNANRPSLCRSLSAGDTSPLKRVFSNQRFIILQIPSEFDFFSDPVEYKPVFVSKT